MKDVEVTEISDERSSLEGVYSIKQYKDCVEWADYTPVDYSKIEVKALAINIRSWYPAWLISLIVKYNIWKDRK